MITLTKEAAQSVLDALNYCIQEGGPCEHESGICVCKEKQAAQVMQSAIDAPEPSGERAALIARLRYYGKRETDAYVVVEDCKKAADMLAADAPEQESVAFEAAWDSIDWDVWRMKPIKELIQHIHSLTAPQARELSDVTAKEKFDKFGARVESDPVERLRFFCSLAMNRQDWLDVEEFFTAVLAARSKP